MGLAGLLGEMTAGAWTAWLATPLLWAMVLAGVGLWLVLPRASLRGQRAGMLLGAVALGLLASLLPPLGPWLEQGIFWGLSALAVAGAAGTISMRSPVYSAICFGLTLLTTAGLLLLLGAQFLGVATVAVYAGAILVTFLFVLMLAQPEGQAHYDRISWGHVPALMASLAAVLIVGGLTYLVTNLDGADLVSAAALAEGGVLDPQHTAYLGGELFSRHLISIQIAGALLLVALVGAVAIVIQGNQPPSEAVPTEPAARRGESDHV